MVHFKIPLRVTKKGLHCPPGDFFIDAWNPVPICIVTHAHGDHAYPGHRLYIAIEETLKFLRHRFGQNLPTKTLQYGEKIKMGGCWISLHPAGHVLGSAQVRIEDAQGVTVISGDYKRAADSSCVPFEVLKCDVFVTESTFALPIYQWLSSELIGEQITKWWLDNASQGHPSVLFCYPLGKSQRIMSLLLGHQKKIYVHGSIFPFAKIYEEMGIALAPFSEWSEESAFSEDLILAPPSAAGTPWMRRFPASKTALASGWMQVRGMRRRQALDRGFVLSDHADWQALLRTIEETEAKIILTTHGNSATLARFLREQKNLDARELKGLELTNEDED